MQYDWKEWMLPVAGKKIKIYVHEVILSCSRKKYYQFTLSITTADIIRVLADSFIFFDGYAKELIMDNAKQMVITHRKMVLFVTMTNFKILRIIWHSTIRL